MDFSYPAEVEQFRKELRAWLAANLSEEVVAAGRRRGRDPETFEVLRAWDATLADAGWGAVSWPQEYGGRGATVLEQLAYAEETTHARAPVPLNVIGMNNIAPAIMQYGTDAQKRELLPRMVRADDIWCQGMSEPEAGSDLASLRTRAVLDGDEYVVNGQKIWTSLGHRADWCQLYVRTDPDAPKHKGISCLIVDMALPGIEVRPLVTLNGATDFAEMFFDDVRVPADALLGPLNGGWQVATTTLSHERAGAARLYAQLEMQLRDLVADLADCRSRRTARARGQHDAAPPRRGGGADQIPRGAVSAIDLRDAARRRRARIGEPGQERVGGARAGTRRPGFRCSRPARRTQPVDGVSPDVAIVDHRRRYDTDQQDRHRDASAGTAAPVNLELTDEQLALRDTVRRFWLKRQACQPMCVRCSTIRLALRLRCGADWRASAPPVSWYRRSTAVLA